MSYNGGGWKLHSKNWPDIMEKALSQVSGPGSTYLAFLLSTIFQLGETAHHIFS